MVGLENICCWLSSDKELIVSIVTHFQMFGLKGEEGEKLGG